MIQMVASGNSSDRRWDFIPMVSFGMYPMRVLNYGVRPPSVITIGNYAGLNTNNLFLQVL